MFEIGRVIVRRPRLEETAMIHEFFEMILRDTFERNGISDLTKLLEEEIQDKKQCIAQDFETGGTDRFFLLAEYKEQIIGSVEHGLANELLNKCTNNELKSMPEIGTVFVHPEYQREGVASLLLYRLFQELSNKGVAEICFDSGYKTAQKIWCKKIGNPEYFLKDYWDEGIHHMVWKAKVKDGLELFTIKNIKQRLTPVI